MDIARAGQILVIMLLPTLIVGSLLYLPHGITLVRRFVTDHDGAGWPQPTHAPIEQLAADLRRLVQRQEALTRSTDVAMRARRLQALEGAIGDCAIEAACALGLPSPHRSVHGPLARPELRDS